MKCLEARDIFVAYIRSIQNIYDVIKIWKRNSKRRRGVHSFDGLH